jgi:cytochrome c5
MDIEEVQVALPRTEGIEAVERSCTPCHSLRYIEMQPELSKATWEKIVTKMIKMYGAPVRDSQEAAAIVRYLVEVKGKK